MSDALNGGVLSANLSALVEQRAGVEEPDVLAIEDQPFELPDGLDRLLMSYNAGREKIAYIEPLAIGDSTPDMPLFLTPHLHVKVPLELTYGATWNVLPQ